MPMVITESARQLWLLRKAPSFLKPKFNRWQSRQRLIDAVINANAGVKLTTEPHNTIAVIRSHMRNNMRVESTESIAVYLRHLATESEYIYFKERSAFCNRLLRRMGENVMGRSHYCKEVLKRARVRLQECPTFQGMVCTTGVFEHYPNVSAGVEHCVNETIYWQNL